MSQRFVIILWSLVGLLAALTLAVKAKRNREIDSPTQLAIGATLLEKLPIQDIASMKIEDLSHTATITRGETQWSVKESAGFKANFPRFSEFLRSLTQITVAQSHPAGPAFNERFGMDGDSENQENHGYKISFFDAEGKEIESLSIGKSTSNDSLQQNPQSSGITGRYVRLGSEPEAVYAVSEPFYGLSAEPTDWLDTTFITINRIQSVDLAAPNEDDFQGWTLTRPNEGDDFEMSNRIVGRELDATKTDEIPSFLSSVTLLDVLSDEEAQERRDESQARQLVIKTYEGFRYTINYAPEKEGSEEEQAFLTKITVAAEIAETREKVEGESEEDAKEADADFAEGRKILEEKLAREQALADHYSYLLPVYLFSSVNLNAEEITRALPEPEPVPAPVPAPKPIIRPEPTAPAPQVAPPAVAPVEAEAAETSAVPKESKPPVTVFSEAVAVPSSETSEPDSNNSDVFQELSDEDIKRIVEDAKKADESQ